MDEQKILIIGGLALLVVVVIVIAYIMSRKKKIESNPVVVHTTAGPIVVPSTTPSSTKPSIIAKPTIVPTVNIPTSPQSTDTLKPGTTFTVGDTLVSKNGLYTVKITPQNKFVISSGGVSVNALGWRQNLVKSISFNSTGNLDFVGPDGKITLTSDTGVPGSVYNIDNDGNLCIMSPTAKCLWWSGYAANLKDQYIVK